MRRFCFPVLLVFSSIAPLEAQPVRLAVAAFGTTAEVEVRDLPRADADSAARAALEELFELSMLLDPASELPGSVGALNAAAGQGPQVLDPQVAEMLRRALLFCMWSNGAYGPLGGRLNELWEDNREARRLPKPGELRVAVNNAACSRLTLAVDQAGEAFLATLAEGSRVDPVGLGRGYAVDRAVGILKERGVENAWVEIGSVMRALGGGLEGEGWLVNLPSAPGSSDPLDQIWLQDQAMTILMSMPEKGENLRPIIDQRTGVEARGVVSVVTVTEQAADAQGLATSLFIIGMRDGQLRLGSLQPRPSVYWLLGEDEGTPVEATYHWSDLKRVRRR